MPNGKPSSRDGTPTQARRVHSSGLSMAYVKCYLVLPPPRVMINNKKLISKNFMTDYQTEEKRTCCPSLSCRILFASQLTSGHLVYSYRKVN
jgi:hypothetical protein